MINQNQSFSYAVKTFSHNLFPSQQPTHQVFASCHNKNSKDVIFFLHLKFNNIELNIWIESVHSVQPEII